jgi:DNA repair protein RadC
MWYFISTSANRCSPRRSFFPRTLAQTSVYPREVVKQRLRKTRRIDDLHAHNHPSGVADPSRADELLTQALKQALGRSWMSARAFISSSSTPGITSFAERGLL